MIFVSLWFIVGQLYAAASDALKLRLPNALILYLLAGYAVGVAILVGGALLFARGWMAGGLLTLALVTCRAYGTPPPVW